jgi:hypothetical protein
MGCVSLIRAAVSVQADGQALGFRGTVLAQIRTWSAEFVEQRLGVLQVRSSTSNMSRSVAVSDAM